MSPISHPVEDRGSSIHEGASIQGVSDEGYVCDREFKMTPSRGPSRRSAFPVHVGL